MTASSKSNRDIVTEEISQLPALPLSGDILEAVAFRDGCGLP